MKKSIICIFFCMLVLTGCSSNTLENNLSQIRIAKASELETGKTRAERAEEIKENILRLEEVEEVAVVIEGRTALIGLQLKEGMEKDAIRLKAEADILAKEADDAIEGTAITANESITAMIKRMERERII